MSTIKRALALAWLRVRIAYLAWRIRRDEKYLRARLRDGIIDSVSARAWRRQGGAQATRLIALMADARTLMRSMRGARHG